MGAVTEGGEVFVDAQIVRDVGATEAEVQEVIARKTAEVEERCRRFRRGHGAPNLEGKTVLLIDDGIATGGTARAALRAIRRRGPRVARGEHGDFQTGMCALAMMFMSFHTGDL
jgi:putative phosphoribosyl transferase